MYELKQLITFSTVGTLSAYVLNICDPKEALVYITTATAIALIARKILPNNDAGIVYSHIFGILGGKELSNAIGCNVSLETVGKLLFCAGLIGLGQLSISMSLNNDRVRKINNSGN